MSSKPSKSTQPVSAKMTPPVHTQGHDLPDDRYPGTFFRVPSVPVQGKTSWSIVR